MSFDSYAKVKGLFVLGITTSTIASGGLLFTSYVHVPGYVKNANDEVLLDQWQTMGAIGKSIVPPLALIAGAANLANSYLTHTQPQHYRFMAAGLLSVAVLPYTNLFLGPTNVELAERTSKSQDHIPELKDQTPIQLIQRWADRSAVRGFLLLASALLSFDGMLHLTF
ncbi:hypothetical protein PV10_07836 [Exophiala mesophila]|uniref:DUF1772-domain-containing protein n=1 Tax=Exophiala mesophila TaxID=212818 RepID=A0A0D1Z953_EXOME|nr:uncharacterized protein PV10_07836 [Exophiala mesophila]KIV90544.1 hypothetical protein PV10_07836 [Exophiala mesophila]